MDFKAGGRAIQQFRRKKGLTQEQLAEQVELSSNTVSHIERGLLMPSVKTFCDLCNALEVSADSNIWRNDYKRFRQKSRIK